MKRSCHHINHNPGNMEWLVKSSGDHTFGRHWVKVRMSSHLVVLVLVKRHRNNGSDDIVLSLCTMYSTICQTVIVLLNCHHTLLRSSSFFKTLVNDRIAPKQAKESISIPYNYSCNVRRCFLNTHKYLNFHALLFFRERIPSSSLFIIGQPINSKVLFKRPCRPFNMFYCYRSSKDYKRKQKWTEKENYSKAQDFDDDEDLKRRWYVANICCSDIYLQVKTLVATKSSRWHLRK